MKFHLTDLYSLGRRKRTDCDLDDNVEDSRTNDGTSANVSLNIATLTVMLPVSNNDLTSEKKVPIMAMKSSGAEPPKATSVAPE